MRAQCSVCQELFSDSDVVVAPQCGHTFHTTCITQWLATKKSCPTCRATTTEKKLIRIFFDIAFTVDIDSGDLQSKLDETTLELQTAQRDLREARHELVTIKKKANKYSREKKEAEEKIRDSEIITANLQQRLDILNRQVNTLGSLETEFEACKAKLKLMENVKRIVDASQMEVEEMLEPYGDKSETARSLTTMCVALSKELNAKTDQKSKVDEELRKTRRHLSTFRVELQTVKKELKEKEDHASMAEEEVKRFAAENAKLQEKLRVLTESISSPSGDPRNSALNRLLNESPAPSNLRLSTLLSQTPSLSSGAGFSSTPPLPHPLNKQRKNAMVPSQLLSSQELSNMRPKLSDPLLEVSPAGPSERKKESRKAETLLPDPETKHSIFKRLKSDPPASSSKSDYHYDGFGGHSKLDVYPRGASSSQPSSSRTSKLGDGPTSLKKRGPVKMKIKGKIQTNTLDDFF